MKITVPKREKVLIVGIRRPKSSVREMEASLEELAKLVETAGGEVKGRLKQELLAINPATFVGKGKIEAIKKEVFKEDIDTVVIDDDLSPAQNRNLAEEVGVKVLDRTAVILDIFARRARTKEGKLQVELAQLEYRLPRLVGRGLALSQQAGYIGNRGPGETKLEVDRRRIRERIAFIKRELKNVRLHREIHRRKREDVPIPTVSIIGYTNSGKSTLMNSLTKAGVFVEDKLFATLDPTIRRLRLPSGRIVLLADTVGFIRRLPHQLIESFKATFEEIERSDVLIHLIDASDEDAVRHVAIVEQVIREIGLNEKPVLRVFNKADLRRRFIRNDGTGVVISALKGTGLGTLLSRLEEMLLKGYRPVSLRIPLKDGAVLSQIYQLGRVRDVRYGARGVRVEADLHRKYIGRYERFIVKR